MNNHIVQMDPMVIQSTMTCLDLRSGMNVYYAKKVVGQVELNCKIDLFKEGLGLQFFPIPTFHQGTLKSRKWLPSNQQFIVQIINMEGKILSQNQYTGSLLFEGLHIQTDFLIAGTYVLKVQSGNWIEFCKFIKL